MSKTRPILDDLRVADVMHPGILACPPDTTLREVARMMAAHNVHAIAVYDGSHGPGAIGLPGIVADLDLASAALANDVDGRTARDTATTPVATVSGREPLSEAARCMVEYATPRLIVVEPDTGHPCRRYFDARRRRSARRA